MSIPAMNAVLPPTVATPPVAPASVPAVAVSMSPVKPPAPPVSKPASNHIPPFPVNLAQEDRPPSLPKDLSPTLPKPTTNGVGESAKIPAAPVSEAIPVPLVPQDVATPPAVLADTPSATTPAVPAVEPTPEHPIADTPPDTTEDVEPLAAVEPAEIEKPKEPKVQAAKRRRKSPAPVASVEDGATAEKKPRRARAPVSPYQSPLPEMTTVLNRSLKVRDNTQKPTDEKLIIFYKNEFLAVRNAEGGFYLCQASQNIYRSSHKVKIRWLSRNDKETAGDGVYTRDFYDTTDFECILTSVVLQKQDKDKFKMKATELERVESILKRAIDVEKGVVEKPAITEAHPDGIDLSLYRDESQLQKPKGVKRKRSTPPKPKSPKKPKKATKQITEKTKTVKSKIKVKKAVDKKVVEAPVQTKSSRADRSAARDKIVAKAIPEPVPSTSKIEKARNKIRANEAKKKQAVVASKPAKAGKEDKKGKAAVTSPKKKDKRGKKSATASDRQEPSRPKRARK